MGKPNWWVIKHRLAKRKNKDDKSNKASNTKSKTKHFGKIIEEDDTKDIGNKPKVKPISFQVMTQTHVGTSKVKNSTALKLFENIEGHIYEKENDTWLFPLSAYTKLISLLQDSDIPVKPIPPQILKLFTKTQTLERTQNTDFSGIPPLLMEALLPFQLNGVQFALEREGKVLIGDDMGLGKTLQAIAIACCYSSEWPVLVICPSSVRTNWVKEFSKWVPRLNRSGSGWTDINEITTAAQDRINFPVNIISYDLVPKYADKIEKQNFQVIIADESHYLKNEDALRTKTIVPLLKNANRSILLTGTASVSAPIELYTQLQALGQEKLFKSRKQYGLRYCGAFQGPHGWDYSGSSNLKELHLVLERTIMIRRLKRDIMPELPQKNRLKVQLEIEQELQDSLKEITRNLSETTKNEKQNLVMQLWQETGKIKIPAVCEYILTMAREQQQFAVFAHHQEVLDSLEKCLIQAKVNYMRIDGNTKSEERYQLISRFQRDGTKCQVALLSITACGTGITLTKAATIVFAELYWTPGVLIQAEDRAHRIGKKDELSIRYLVAKNTIDDKIWDVVEKKLDVVGQTLNGQMEEMIPANPSYASLLANLLERNNEVPLQKPKRRRQAKDTVQPAESKTSKSKKQKTTSLEEGKSVKKQQQLSFTKVPKSSEPSELSTQDCVTKFFQLWGRPIPPLPPSSPSTFSTEVLVVSDSDDEQTSPARTENTVQSEDDFV